ncbi:MAG: FtsX-like permease family protein [Candidatus Competibacteraceae bacterium]
MFRVLFLFMFLIVTVIIVMSVVNTVSMAVLERSREIGTLRAIGAKRYRIVSLFGLEGALLGLFGSLLGVMFFALVLGIIGFWQPTWIPPQIARSIPLEVYVVPNYLLASGLLLILLSFAAGIFPARRIALRNIVEALGHV